MRKTGLPLILFGLLLVLSLHTNAAYGQATRTWVSGVGDDANPCSRTAPCKTFAGAISKTLGGGEIDCLDPGGFGAVTITKALTIDCGTFPGGILNTGVNGVIVNAGASDKVVLRNLVIQGTTSGTQGVNGVRFLAGQELHLDRVVIQGKNTLCVDVNKTASGFLYVRNSYFTECPTGINLTTTVGNVVATVETSIFSGLATNGVAANAGALANVSRSVFTNLNGIALSAGTSGAKLNADSNVVVNCFVGASVVTGATLTMAGNFLHDNVTGINVAASSTFLSSGDNKVSGGTAGSTSTGPIPLR